MIYNLNNHKVVIYHKTSKIITLALEFHINVPYMKKETSLDQ